MIMGIAAGQMLHSSEYVPTTIGESVGVGYYIGDITVGSDTYAVVMAGSSRDSYLSWGPDYTTTPGIFSDVDGVSNTALMISAGSHSAAIFCTGYTGDGRDDWYLPAKNELYLAWENRAALAPLSMSAVAYWTSTLSDTYNIYVLDFSSGTSTTAWKPFSKNVRPVRRILK